MIVWIAAFSAVVLMLGTISPALAARLESARCGFWVPPRERATCHYLVVPEWHERARSRSIRVFVAIFHARTAQPAADPIIFLNGGPGDGNFVDDSAEAWWEDSAPFREHRDFIVVDQRGVGRSQPLLDCPELDRNADANHGRRIDEVRQADLAAALACRDRLVAAGVDLSAYTTRQSAADVDSLASALGVPRYNLMALSYGTRLALAVMRRAPTRVRSVVLDSVYPPGVYDYADRPWLTARVFRRLFQDCAAQPACSSRSPDLGPQFEALVARLAATPDVFTQAAGYRRPPITIDGMALIESLSNAFFHANMIAELPIAITQAIQGNYRRIEPWLGDPGYSDMINAEGMALSIECSENLPFNSPAGLAERVNAFAPYGLTAPLALEWLVCPHWGAEAVPLSDHEPVISDIPTLLLTGSYDPVTPPEWAHAAAAALSRSTVLEFAAGSHALLLTEPCAESASIAFINDPGSDVTGFCPDRSRPPEFIVD